MYFPRWVLNKVASPERGTTFCRRFKIFPLRNNDNDVFIIFSQDKITHPVLQNSCLKNIFSKPLKGEPKIASLITSPTLYLNVSRIYKGRQRKKLHA